MIGIRDARREDRDFIENAWRATMLATSPQVAGADPRHWHDEATNIFSRLFPKALVRVAFDEKQDDNLVGFVAATGPELHYVYVTGSLRRVGIATQLLDGLGITRYTFRTAPGDRHLRPAERGWKFTPRFTLY